MPINLSVGPLEPNLRFQQFQFARFMVNSELFTENFLSHKDNETVPGFAIFHPRSRLVPNPWHPKSTNPGTQKPPPNPPPRGPWTQTTIPQISQPQEIAGSPAVPNAHGQNSICPELEKKAHASTCHSSKYSEKKYFDPTVSCRKKQESGCGKSCPPGPQ